MGINLKLNAPELAETNIFTLPIEITTEIFTWLQNSVLGPSTEDVVTDKHASEASAIKLTERCIIGLAGVCQLWRRIVRECPMLWNAMNFDNSSTIPLDKQLEKVQEFLYLSREASFSIQIRVLGTGVSSYVVSQLMQLKDALQPHSARCASFSFAGDEKAAVYFPLQEDMPNLRALDVRTSTTHGGPTRLPLSLILAPTQAPHLTHVSLDLHCPLRPYVLMIDWSRVESLKLVSLFVEMWNPSSAVLLSECHNLKRLELTGSLHGFNRLSQARITLPTLIDLQLDNLPPDLPPRLIAPNLTRLVLALEDGWSVHGDRPIYQLPGLKSLKITTGFQCWDEQLLPILIAFLWAQETLEECDLIEYTGFAGPCVLHHLISDEHDYYCGQSLSTIRTLHR